MTDAVGVMNRWTSGRRPDETMAKFQVRALAIAADEHVVLQSEITRLRTRVEEAEAKQKIDQAQCDEMTEQAGTMAMEISTLRAQLEAAEADNLAERERYADMARRVVEATGCEPTIGMGAIQAVEALRTQVKRLEGVVEAARKFHVSGALADALAEYDAGGGE